MDSLEPLEARRRQRLGQLLVLGRQITEAELRRALEEQGKTHELLGEILIRHGAALGETIARTVSEQTGIPLLLSPMCRPDATLLLSAADCRQYRLIPVRIEGSIVHLAMANPFEVAALDFVRVRTDLIPFPNISPWSTVLAAIELAYGPSTEGRTQ